MRTPSGFRSDSARTPRASRAGALQRQRQRQLHYQFCGYGSHPSSRSYRAEVPTMSGRYAADFGGGL